jgi:Uma2 family endonuclease
MRSREIASQSRYRRVQQRKLSHAKGLGLSKSSIDTSAGVKVPDVVWASRAFTERYGLGSPFPKAPEICVEIVSPSNSETEIQEKSNLYFEQGAHEVWLCNLEGQMRFLTPDGELERSAMVADFPTKLEF